MRLRIPALALLAGVTAMMVSCDLMETPKVSQSAPSAAAIAARAQAVADSTTKYRDSLLACRKADSISAATTRKSWLSDSAALVAAAKKIAADSAAHLAADLKTRKNDSTAAAKARKTDSTKFAKDSLAGVKTLSSDSLKIDKVMRNDSSAYERAKAAMWAKYTKDSLLWEAAVNTKYAALLAKDSAAIAAAEALIAAEDETTTDKLKAAHQAKLEKANAKLLKDLATQQKAIDAALAKITKDSLAGEAAMAKVLTKRATDSATYYGKYSKDSLTIVGKLSKDSTTWATDATRDSTKLYADSVARDTKYQADTLARHIADSTRVAHTTADSLAMFKADSAFLYRKGVVSFSPAPGIYSSVSSKDITLSSGYNGTGAAIYYTTDGSVPNASSTLYTGPITLTIGQTIRAIAVQPGYDTSVVIAGTYVIGTAATPTFSPAAGTYVDSQKVVVTSASDSVYYTLDGTVPTTSSAKANTGDTIIVNKTESLKAMAFLYGRTNSVVATAAYTIVADTPTIAFVNARQKVVISTGTIGAQIRYTTNGTVPTAASTLYTDSIAISGATTVKAIAVKTGLTSSAVATKALVALPTPAFASATTDSTRVTITSAGADSIVYTRDGTTPVYLNGTLNGTRIVAGGTVTLAIGDTIKAVAFRKTGDTVNSAVGQGNYISQAKPTFAIATTDSTRVTITSGSGTTAADSIYYTIDGSTLPTSSSLKIANGGKVTLTAGKTIIAKAVKAGKVGSDTAKVVYTQQAKPTFSIATTDSTRVTITSASADSFYYTVDGSTLPTSSSTKIAANKWITLTAGKTIIAKAVRAGYVGSDTAKVVYAQQAKPTASIATTDSSRVSFASASADSFYFTTNGTLPNASSSKIAANKWYTAISPATIIVKAVKAGAVGSDTAKFIYAQQAKPTFSVVTTDSTRVTLTSASADSFYYTTDGSTLPSASSSKIANGGHITRTTGATIIARAVRAGYVSSDTAKVVVAQQAKPTLAAVTTDSTRVTFTSASADSFYYTTDGSTLPTSASSKIAAGAHVTLTSATTIIARAIKSGVISSDTAKVAVTVQATPVVALGSDHKTVSFTSASADSIVYTEDGTDPSYTNGTRVVYGTTLVITAGETVKAIALKSGKITSAVGTGVFTQQAKPTFTATVTDSTRVTFTSASADSFYYTTDGSTLPTSASSKIAASGHVTLTGPTTIIVRAVKSGVVLSDTAKASLTQPVKPTFTVLTTDSTRVTLTSAGASPADSFYYTTDGSTIPTSASSKIAANGWITVTSGTTIIAKAVSSSALLLSDSAKVVVAVQATPTVVLGANHTTVTFTSASADSIVYTEDGTDPSHTNGTRVVYGTTLTISGAETVKAIALKSTKVTSAVGTATIAQQAKATFGIVSTDSSRVTLTSASADSFYYTLDGSTLPTSASSKIAANEWITLTTGATIIARAVKTGAFNSDTSLVTYTKQADPTFGAGAGITITGGAIDTAGNGGAGAVTIASTGADAIYYTTNGSAPTTSSTLYSGPIDVTTDETIKAIAVKAGKVLGLAEQAYTVP